MEGKSKEQSAQYIKMTQTPIPKLVLMLGLPTTISMLVTNIYNVADTYFVSQLGTSASGAVGIIFGLMSIIQAFGFMLGQGSGSILSRSLGAKDVEKASRIASKAFFTALTAGAGITVIGLLLLDPLMRLLGSTDTILPYARTYATYILLAAPFMTASFTMNNIIRYEGRAAYAMIGLMTGGLLNIFGDWFLMEICHLGIRGAGISTAVSQCISFSILLFMFLSGRTQCRLSLRRCREAMEEKELMAISKTGFPSMVRQGLSSISTMLLNSRAAVYGDAAVAAMSIVGRICFFAFAVGLGIGQGFQPVSAYNYGAKKYARVRQAFFFTVIVGEVLLSIMVALGLIFSKEIIGIFRDDADVISIATVALRAQLCTLILLPMTSCTNMLFQSVGRNKEATILASLRNGLAFMPALLILSTILGLTGIQISQSVADIVTCAVSVCFAIKFIKALPAQDEQGELT
ncbi:MAG: MATE family efflux transporter [Lachnospiraceae bacterium]|nr:MATE family efflux transporter [Lachnospiraceae bacterium]